MRTPSCLFAMGLAVALALHAEEAEQLTAGPGNDTEAAWSPDGKRIAFQTDRNGDLDIYLLDLDTKEIKPLVAGPGHACFPAWAPDGKWIVYSFAHFTRTAFEKNENGCNLFVVPADGGEPRRLTSGLFRDYSPVVARDGKSIRFSSARNPKTNAVSILSIPADGGEPTPVVPLEDKEEAAVQPDFSADGRFLAYGYIKGFRENWSLRLAKAMEPTDAYPLTDSRAAFYGPRWSPKQPVIACTGFQVGDPGWNVWLIGLDPLREVRVTSGAGNSRSPNWSPDGRQIVFESNRTGLYKLFRISVPDLPKEAPPLQEADRNRGAVLRYDFSQRPGEAIADLSERKNNGTICGGASWENGAMQFREKGAWIAVDKPKGFDFGPGTFTVKATVSVPAHMEQLRMICVGDYPGNRQGWQLYLAPDGRAYFNSRTPEKLYKGASSSDPLPTGRPVTLVGVRLESGIVKLYVDGALQRRTSADAFISYPAPDQVRIGSQWNGESPFGGGIHDISVYTRELTPAEIRGDSLQRFLRD